MNILDKEVEKIYSVFKSLSLSSEIFTSEADYLHKKRIILDTFIFDSLKKLYSEFLKNYWDKNSIPYDSDKAIVIVERRCHPNLEFILHNVSYFAPGYTIHIFCSKANLSFIELVCGSQINNIHIHPIFENIGTPEQGKTEYNNLLKTKTFWKSFKEEHILIIETDCYLLKHIPESIYKYDYVSSQWPWLKSEPGGGGLSYRKCSIMKKICELSDKSLKEDTMQDTFASNGVKILGLSFSHDFFTEALILTSSIGTHQWWTFYNVNMIKNIIRYYLILSV
jgi:hypothetical protein